MKKFILLLLFSPLLIFGQNCNTYYINMLDSLGDGWNGNTLSIVDSSGNILLSTTLSSGFSATDSICLTDDCFTITCDGGTSQSEVSWNFTDHNGTVLFSGGAPYIDTISSSRNEYSNYKVKLGV